MDFYYLDAVKWEYSQALYHAAAHLGRESLFLLRPSTPYVCIGFHQDAKQEIDLDFTREHSIPVFRREVGGGAVFLDGMQLFFQLIIRRDRAEVPRVRLISTGNSCSLSLRHFVPLVCPLNTALSTTY